MTAGDTVKTPREARPQLEDAVRIGPGLWDGGSRRFVLHDPRTGWYFRIGEHEHFLVSRMDGVRTVDQLEDEFIDHYERRLSEPLWQSILSLLGQRGLLVGSVTPVQLRSLRDARERERGESRTWLHARMPIVRADGILRRMAAGVRLVDHPAVWVLVWLATSALVVHVILNWTSIWPAARSLWTDPVAIIVFIVIMWASLVLHELAHGVTAWAYGARDIEIGVMWRLPFFSPYCKVDDTMLFHDRSRRVRVALAGVTVSVAVCLPFWLLSVLVTDAFMTAVKEDAPWELTFNGTHYKTLRARERWPQFGFSTGFGMTELAGNVMFMGRDDHERRRDGVLQRPRHREGQVVAQQSLPEAATRALLIADLESARRPLLTLRTIVVLAAVITMLEPLLLQELGRDAHQPGSIRSHHPPGTAERPVELQTRGAGIPARSLRVRAAAHVSRPR